ncbi:hypothetical protein HYX15_02370 [Candidatus Woesearchaeota archaeon]|nr:hypothetical protein [Candidatus Woesearchaeota archaeon]
MPDINLPKMNQPLYVLGIFLIGLGFSELNNIRFLFWISLIGSIWMALLVCWSMAAYSIDYYRKKLRK